MDLKSVMEQVKSLCLEVGSFIEEQNINFDTKRIEFKGPHDYVSYVDKTAEKRLVEGLEKILPQAGFLAEEGSSHKEGERYTWIIDPLDGTTNFIHKIPFFAISIALQDKQGKQGDEIVLGIVYHISMKEMFYAYTGVNTCCNSDKAVVSTMPTLENALIATGFPYYDYSRLPSYMRLLEYTMQHTAGVRRLGSAALDLAYVACGRCELFYEYGLQPWDVAAGLFLVKQSGGKVCDFSGGSNYLFGKEIVATNTLVHEQFMNILRDHNLCN